MNCLLFPDFMCIYKFTGISEGKNLNWDEAWTVSYISKNSLENLRLTEVSASEDEDG